MAGVSSYISIPSLNANRVGSPIRRHRCLKNKKDPTIRCLQETHFSFKDTQRLKVRGYMKVFHRNENRKNGGIVILTSEKIDVKKK